jgi:hypothetical protein
MKLFQKSHKTEMVGEINHTKDNVMKETLVSVTTKLIIQMDDDVDIGDVLSEMDYGFISQTEGAEITDTEITDYNVHGGL